MDIAVVLKEAGPYTAPLCGGMAVAMHWILRDREKIAVALRESQQREREMGEKRTAQLLESTAAMADAARVIEKALDGHDRILEKAIETWKSSKD